SSAWTSVPSRRPSTPIIRATIQAENDKMVDQTLQKSGSSKSEPEALKSVRDQAVAAGCELKDQAADLAASSGDKLKEQASEFADAAKNVASQATDRLKEKVSEQRGVGAEYVGSLAETIRRAAREFDNDLPIA